MNQDCNISFLLKSTHLNRFIIKYIIKPHILKGHSDISQISDKKIQIPQWQVGLE